MMKLSFTLVIITMVAGGQSQRLFAGQDATDAINIMFEYPECFDFLTDLDWSPYETSACGSTTCNFPTEMCMEDYTVLFGDPQVFECRTVPLTCYNAVMGPSVTTTTTQASTNLGSCPAPPSPAGWCVDFCVEDTDCWTDEKCCSNGCGKECMIALTNGQTNPPTTSTTTTTTTTQPTTTTSTTTTTTTTRPPTTTTTSTINTSTPTSTTPVTTVPSSGNARCNEPLNFGLGLNPTEKYYFNGQICYPFPYSGSFGNGNNFVDQQECEANCVTTKPDCFAPSVRGSGINYRLRYYYTGNYCGAFWYAGTGGNSNNFADKNDCEAKCGGAISQTTTRAPVTTRQTQTTRPTTTTTTTQAATTTTGASAYDCSAEYSAGTGRNYQRRYWYTGSVCQVFYYRGLGGSLNNFATVRDCEAKCLTQTTTTLATTTTGASSALSCSLPSSSGSGRDWQTRYKWNGVECAVFWWAGSGGNGNNFATRLECQATCGGGQGVTTTTTQAPTNANDCTSPRVVGSQCSGCQWTYSFYFNTVTQSCSSFWYAGAGGNGNRYSSLANCKAACP